MSETPTGTDRVELTNAERGPFFKMLADYKWNWITTADALAVVESIVAARVQALTAEVAMLRGVMTRYEGTVIHQERRNALARLDAAESEREASRAELAAANARIRELEAGIAKLRDGMHEFMRGNWPESPTPVEVYSALAALTPEGTE